MKRNIEKLDKKFKPNLEIEKDNINFSKEELKGNKSNDEDELDLNDDDSDKSD